MKLLGVIYLGTRRLFATQHGIHKNEASKTMKWHSDSATLNPTTVTNVPSHVLALYCARLCTEHTDKSNHAQQEEQHAMYANENNQRVHVAGWEALVGLVHTIY